jgi:hypothetical protein
MSTEVRLSKYLRSHGSRLRVLLRQPQLRWSPAIDMTAKELIIDTLGFGATSNETINDLVSSCATDEDHDYPMSDLDAITGSIADHTVDSPDATYRDISSATPAEASSTSDVRLTN